MLGCTLVLQWDLVVVAGIVAQRLASCRPLERNRLLFWDGPNLTVLLLQVLLGVVGYMVDEEESDEWNCGTEDG